MTTTAPTPQEQARQRVLTISRVDGWSVAVVAASGSLLALVLGDLFGTVLGLLAVASGWMELRGNHKLRHRNAGGMSWLVRSQLFLLAVILAYCGSRLGSYNQETLMGKFTPEVESLLRQAGIEKAALVPLVRLAFFGLYGAVAVAGVIYQGGLALYYRGKTRLVTEALRAPPQPVHLPVTM